MFEQGLRSFFMRQKMYLDLWLQSLREYERCLVKLPLTCVLVQLHPRLNSGCWCDWMARFPFRIMAILLPSFCLKQRWQTHANWWYIWWWGCLQQKQQGLYGTFARTQISQGRASWIPGDSSTYGCSFPCAYKLKGIQKCQWRLTDVCRGWWLSGREDGEGWQVFLSCPGGSSCFPIDRIFLSVCWVNLSTTIKPSDLPILEKNHCSAKDCL